MQIKSISYEYVISSLIDACALTDDRKEDLSIKRSFITKQTIFSDVLFERLLAYLSGEDENLRVVIGNFFEVLEEVMKDMCSSPFLLDMSKEAFNDEFKKTLIIPFVALLLFNMRFDFKETSPIYYFIDFISKNTLTAAHSLDALIREYIKGQLKSCNIPHGAGDDFRNFIGKISLNSSLKSQTIKTKIDELKSECDFMDEERNSIDLYRLSLSLYGMRLVLCFKDYIDDLICCYCHAKQSTKYKGSAYWDTLVKIAKEIIIRKNKKKIGFHKKFDEMIYKTSGFAIEYNDDLAMKYNKSSDVIYKYLMGSSFCRDFSLNLLKKNEHLKDSINYNMLDVFINIYNGEFALATSKMSVILNVTVQRDGIDYLNETIVP